MRIKVETDLIPPRLTEKHVRRVLAWINPEDLKGLDCVRVIEDCPDDPAYAKRARYLSGFLRNGHYQLKTKDRQPEVVLYASDVYYGVPKRLAGSAIATLKLGRVLAHEVGHHVVATKGYIHNPWEKYKEWTGRVDPYEEDMAWAYASDVVDRMKRHWRYKIAAFLTRKFASILYSAAIADYWDGNYRECAQEQFRAYHLDLTNEKAGQCYRHAMEKLKTQTPSPLSDAERDWLLNGYDGNPHKTIRLKQFEFVKARGRRQKKRAPKARRST